MKLAFLGAAGTVTGSKTLVTHDGKNVLIDCGLFQGYKNLRQMNWEPFPFDPKQLDAVVLTHGHLDHSGAVPLLVKQGYRGPIFATAATIDVCRILLPDSGRIQEEDAEYHNRHKISKHEKALPLYTEDDALKAMDSFRPIPFDQRTEVATKWHVRMRPAGHILGASSIELSVADKVVLFSGDLGRPDDLLMREPVPIERADHIVVESTYGNRLHDPQDNESILGDAITRTARRGGIVVIPAFALGRAQALLYSIWRLKSRGAIPDLPVFLNSPMAIDMTEIYHRHRTEHRLTIEECQGMCHVAKMVRTVDESRALNSLNYPAIIVSASGMATGGRVLHHLKTMAPNHRNTIIFAGFQAGGTRGARMVAGERSIRIHGQDVAVNAEVMMLHGMSAHADAQQIIEWLASSPQPPRGVYINHGESDPADALRQRIERELGWSAMVPRLGQTIELPS
ncbi:MAG: MBL fold metallo-hydrolase [Gammaproteobacteria bacterium]|nr:MBL fold metallo-hydrolase [Gammaproteobacteria bacterium]MBU0786544.1 MBL fold metallo-hydrolase [Gammaproteobacteria bacterium]MBU0817152.1 MBL fold metallo-hydrolase [Gammaproteobacteria bacterium]MBU1787727.1 MBL fold metallo-hydrolase [Gammaproteobacteria bacterium]